MNSGGRTAREIILGDHEHGCECPRCTREHHQAPGLEHDVHHHHHDEELDTDTAELLENERAIEHYYSEED